LETHGGVDLRPRHLHRQLAGCAFDVRGGEQRRERAVLARVLGGGRLQVRPQVARCEVWESLVVQADQAAARASTRLIAVLAPGACAYERFGLLLEDFE